MKKLFWVLLPLLLLAGCTARETMETLADVPVEGMAAPQRQISVNLPDEAAVPTAESDSGRIYLCKDYEIIIQTLEAGDLDETIRTLSGYDRDSLTVVKTRVEGADRYDFVWATAGETGERLGRAVILDDGNYHYTMTVLKDAEATKKTQVVWRTVFESFSLV
ncbi:MAG: hypothetical protein SPI15_06780 [Candidatus Faecousia sp.]|nr:hypothetical protein [Clostridiales bacterium]MDY6180541.1 hypothetical protein [Candidatus Faecousia sp.]